MINLFTHDLKIEVSQDNPIYEQLKALDGKFVGVAVVQVEETPKPPVVFEEPKEVIYFNSERYLDVLKKQFENTVTFSLLSSALFNFIDNVGECSAIRVLERKFGDYRIATKKVEDTEYKLLIPTEFVVENVEA